jgi:hypothetical protein
MSSYAGEWKQKIGVQMDDLGSENKRFPLRRKITAATEA